MHSVVVRKAYDMARQQKSFFEQNTKVGGTVKSNPITFVIERSTDGAAGLRSMENLEKTESQLALESNG